MGWLRHRSVGPHRLEARAHMPVISAPSSSHPGSPITVAPTWGLQLSPCSSRASVSPVVHNQLVNFPRDLTAWPPSLQRNNVLGINFTMRLVLSVGRIPPSFGLSWSHLEGRFLNCFFSNCSSNGEIQLIHAGTPSSLTKLTPSCLPSGHSGLRTWAVRLSGRVTHVSSCPIFPHLVQSLLLSGNSTLWDPSCSLYSSILIRHP